MMRRVASLSPRVGCTIDSATNAAIAPSVQLAVSRGRSRTDASTGSAKKAIAVSENGPPDAYVSAVMNARSTNGSARPSQTGNGATWQTEREHRRRPRAERHQPERERRRVDDRVVDEPLADQHHGHERKPQQREPQLIDRSEPWRVYHSSSPRRIASATAAARSDTPSFSYSRAW